MKLIAPLISKSLKPGSDAASLGGAFVTPPLVNVETINSTIGVCEVL
jgi:hypothetical protein